LISGAAAARSAGDAGEVERLQLKCGRAVAVVVLVVFTRTEAPLAAERYRAPQRFRDRLGEAHVLDRPYDLAFLDQKGAVTCHPRHGAVALPDRVHVPQWRHT